MNHSPTETRKPYWSVSEIADRLAVCKRTIRREIEAGKLIAHRFGRSVRISDADLQNYERLRRLS